MKIRYIVFLTFLFVSCETPEKRINSEIETRFNKQLISHMIDRNYDLVGMKALYPIENSDSSLVEKFNHRGAYAYKTYEVNNGVIRNLYEEFKLQNKAHSENTIINTLEDFDCKKGNYTTLSFYLLKSELELNNNFLPSDYLIYYLDAKPGKWIPEASLVLDKCENEWSHGYSKGLIVNEKRSLVIFWLVAW